ncbi:MAG: ATP-binding cassette domain-containing protein [Promethearchaeota archaeon]
MDNEKSEILIQFSNVEKKYPSVTALQDISFEINKGEVFCLLGPNGSGKTTSIKLITGQIKPTNGNIFVRGSDPIKDRNEIIHTFGYVPQDIALYMELTGRENLHFHGELFNIPKNKLDKRIDEMLEVAGLIDRQNDQVRTYSGGMQRRLQLVRALLHDPEIILLDEPTLGIDVQSRRAINDHILNIAKMGKTVIVTTNYLVEAEKLADRLVILDNHIVAGPATVKEVQEQTFPESLLIFETLTEKITPDFVSIIQTLSKGEILSKRESGDRTKFKLKSGQSTQFLLENLLNISKEQDIPILGMTVKTPSLEDVFLKLTGKEFRDSPNN